MILENKQLEFFEENGYLVLRNFAKKELCDEILKKAKKHLDAKIEPFQSEQEYINSNEDKLTIRRLRQVYQREDIFKEWMLNKKIKLVLQQVLEDVPILVLAHHNSIMTKIPFDSTKTYWHQDRRYWHYENDNLVSVWLALGDEYLENGLLEFIPKSHKMTFSKDRFDEKSNFLDDNIENKELIKTKIHTNLKQGDVVLFHCKTLHYAEKNITQNIKISFVYTVRAKNNLPIKNTRSDTTEIVL